MRHARPIRGLAWIALAIWAGSSGCIHNHYYGAVPGCPPGGPTVATPAGAVCEVPAGAGSNVVIQAPASGGSPILGPNPQKVVISQPTFGSAIGRGVSRLKWRRPDPEGVATIRSEGGLDDGTVQR